MSIVDDFLNSNKPLYKTCKGCLGLFEFWEIEEDHIVPRSKGGGDDPSNLQSLCGRCNRIKSDHNMEYLKGYLAGERNASSETVKVRNPLRY